MSEPLCTKARLAIKQRNFIGWQGLPAICHAIDLFPGLPTDLKDMPVRHLGESFRPTIFVLLSLEGYYRPMASFDGDQLVLFDGMGPELADGFAPLKADVGEPAAKFNWFFGTVKIQAGEWAYPERGITVFLNTTADTVLHIALYQPTTLNSYVETLRPPLRKTLNKKS